MDERLEKSVTKIAIKVGACLRQVGGKTLCNIGKNEVAGSRIFRKPAHQRQLKIYSIQREGFAEHGGSGVKKAYKKRGEMECKARCPDLPNWTHKDRGVWWGKGAHCSEQERPEKKKERLTGQGTSSHVLRKSTGGVFVWRIF